jgi:hypothetical protein
MAGVDFLGPLESDLYSRYLCSPLSWETLVTWVSLCIGTAWISSLGVLSQLGPFLTLWPEVGFSSPQLTLATT